MSFNSDITKQAQKIFFLKRKMIQVIPIYTLIVQEYNDILFENILAYF